MLRTDELIIKIISGLDSLYGDSINLQKTRGMLESILNNYDVTTKCTAVALLDDLPEKIFFYLASKKIDGLSVKSTLKNYKGDLDRFSKTIKKKCSGHYRK